MRRKLPDVLGGYAAKSAARFHMPGHKGRGMSGFFSDELIGWDITELSFSDNLNNPCDSIEQAQQECAASFGAWHSFFLVNGSTAGIQAFMLALPVGSRLLIARDCHRAVINAAGLFSHSCRFFTPAYIKGDNVYGCPTPKALEEELKEFKADVVVITSPNYYGFCADIKGISEVARKYGALLFVDAAHGAHFPFSDMLPGSPASYADAWVCSAHKTLNALGQAAYLNISKNIDKTAIQKALTFLQTSSPSYLLMASLDWARYTASLGDGWSACVKSCRKLKGEVDEILGLKALRVIPADYSGIFEQDETRVVIDVADRGITGFEAAVSLERNNVYVEMADDRRIVLICTPSDDPVWRDILIESLLRLPYGKQGKVKEPNQAFFGEYAMSVDKAMRLQTVSVPLSQAANRIAGESIGIYPPGIPLIIPGERIASGHVNLLEKESALGASLFGVIGGKINIIK